jgi:hypothetical protein
MSRKAIVSIGLSILVGTGLGTTLSGLGVRPSKADVPATVSMTVQPVNWGDAGGEKGEVEAPRWGDTGGEKGEVESPRGADQTTDGQGVQSPRGGDQGGEQGEVEAPRA